MKPPELVRHFDTLHATALNMSNMIGIGPFITIPLLMTAMGGPQAMLGWIIALLIVVPDGMVWSELAAAMPGSGGTYRYLREGFGPERWGRLLSFLFIWQFIFSGPLEIASGYIGFAKYLGYIWQGLSPFTIKLLAGAVGLVNLLLLYGGITRIAKMTIWLWAGALVTTAAVIISGVSHFDSRVAFDFPNGAFNLSLGFFLGLGAASRVGVYDYLGYYDICYLGDEVKNPGRVIPRSIMISVVGVALIYIAVNFSIIGVVSWREFVPADIRPGSDYVVSLFMEKIYGGRVAAVFTGMILWTAFGSVFALLLGYSRIPYAAARDGYFFSPFSRLHPTKSFPHFSLLLIGVISIGCSFVSLGTVIDALITTRILVQFIGQIAAAALLRRTAPELPRPYKIWLYPLPSLIALVGWIYIFVTTDVAIILFGLLTLAVGIACFLMWSWRAERWPFGVQAENA